MRELRRRRAGTAQLEFALTLIVIGIVVALALQQLARLQRAAALASAETAAVQRRAASVLADGCDLARQDAAARARCVAEPAPIPRNAAAP
ncbi:hypothetical protein HLB44_29390 [Aquincola sp. S2]|uniref:Pilus assembly protein TadE n=1 Tax=Pseudaquabacterium terrae TaxID=2732868 RepID=A0ABX2ER64_9BURK|nr:hypothetical protein [Aquabacterium terrae]NRF71118.1 hypothetical protein [Aquabacterium terrae]